MSTFIMQAEHSSSAEGQCTQHNKIIQVCDVMLYTAIELCYV